MLKKIRELTHRYAIVSSILIAILFILFLNGTSLAFRLLPPLAPVQYAKEIFLMLCSVGLVILLGFKSTFKFKGFLKGLLCASVIIVFMLFSLGMFFVNTTSNPDTVWASTGMIIFGLFQAIGIGVREECFFRGAIQNILAKKYANSVKGVWIAALVTSVIFALIHSLNVFAGYDPLIVLIQTISAVASGLFFAAIYLRSGNIWVLILLHTLIDTVGLVPSTFLGATLTENLNDTSWGVATLILWVAEIGYAAFLLRPSKCKEIQESLCFAEDATETEPQA